MHIGQRNRQPGYTTHKRKHLHINKLAEPNPQPRTCHRREGSLFALPENHPPKSLMGIHLKNLPAVAVQGSSISFLHMPLLLLEPAPNP
jgi:hypothetical protein